MTVSEITKRLELDTFGPGIWYIQSTCATTGDGLYESLDWLSSTLSRKEKCKWEPKTLSTKSTQKEEPVKKLKFPTASELKNDRIFLKAFEECTLPIEEWSHKAHVRMAFLYHQLYTNDEATEKIKSGIRLYNSAFQKHTSYHETMTLFWIRIIQSALLQQSLANVDILQDFEAFIQLHSYLLNSKLFLEYYSAEVMFSQDARQKFISPNVKPLPELNNVENAQARKNMENASGVKTIEVQIPVITFKEGCAVDTSSAQNNK